MLFVAGVWEWPWIYIFLDPLFCRANRYISRHFGMRVSSLIVVIITYLYSFVAVWKYYLDGRKPDIRIAHDIMTKGP